MRHIHRRTHLTGSFSVVTKLAGAGKLLTSPRMIILDGGFGGVKCAETLRDLQEWRSRA
jgi:hypothetical protein